jgi:hypothetical protein
MRPITAWMFLALVAVAGCVARDETAPFAAPRAGPHTVDTGSGIDPGLFTFGWDSGWRSLGSGQLTSDPALVDAGGGQLAAFARGTDNALYANRFDGSAWGGWEGLAGQFIGTPSAVATSGGQIEVFVRDATDHVAFRYYDPFYGWTDWVQLDGTCGAGSPVAVIDATTRAVDLFVVDASSSVSHRRGTLGPSPARFSAWEDLGTSTTSTPAVAVQPGGKVDIVVVRDDVSPAQLLHRELDGTQWSAWHDLDGRGASAPAIVSTAAGSLDVVVVGADSQLYAKHGDGAAFDTAWQSLQGEPYHTNRCGDGYRCSGVARPAVTTVGPDAVEVFVQGTDAQTYHKERLFGVWSAWERLPGCLGPSESPAVVGDPQGGMQVVVIGADNLAYHERYGMLPGTNPSSPPACEVGKQGGEMCRGDGGHCDGVTACVGLTCGQPPLSFQQLSPLYAMRMKGAVLGDWDTGHAFDALVPGIAQMTVESPAIVFSFPIAFRNDPDVPYDGGYVNPSQGDIGRFSIDLEVCLTPDQKGSYPVGDPSVPESCPAAGGFDGQWYVVSHGDEALGGPASSLAPEKRTSVGGTITDQINIPVALKQVNNPLRFHWREELYEDHIYWHKVVGEDKYTPPLLVRVLPAALMQAKAIPYTIVYAPPGNFSKATFATTTMFATTMTLEDGTQVDNSSGMAHSVSDGESVEESFAGSSFKLEQTNKWDVTTTRGVGLGTTKAVTTTTSFLSGHTWTLSNATAIPGAKGDYAHEPFWGDTFVLLENPQFGIWDFGGKAAVQLVGARGSIDQPQYAEPTVADLHACANALPPYAGGYPLPSGQRLTAQECLDLLALDPFYAIGQARHFDTTGADPRAQPVGGTDYGMDPAGTGSDLNVLFSQSITWTQTQTDTSTSTYSLKITDMVGSSASMGLTLGAEATAFGLKMGLKANVTLTQGETLTNSNELKITFKNSTATTQQSATAITGSLDDHHPDLGYRPHANFFVDKLFGGYMFQDPTAP